MKTEESFASVTILQAKRARQKPARPWTTQELSTLRKNADLGAPALAELLGRSEKSIREMARAHRISLRRPGETRGLILGHPRGYGLKDVERLGIDKAGWLRMWQGVALGKLDLNRLNEAASRQSALARGAPLCPSCSMSPQEVESTGYCRDCHLRKLAEAHRFAVEHSQAQQELWTARQAKVRSRHKPPTRQGWREAVLARGIK